MADIGDEWCNYFDDDNPNGPQPGEIFETPGGSLYEVQESRRVDSAIWWARFRVTWLKLEPGSEKPDRMMFWWPRKTQKPSPRP